MGRIVNIIYKSAGTAVMAIFILAAAVVTGSCTKEKEGACPANVSLKFVYLHNPDYKDYFSDEVNDVGLYLFDESNSLVFSRAIPKSSLNSGNHYNFKIDKGNYTAVVWGNLKGSSYRLADNGSFNNMMLNLVTNENGESGTSIENLFYGATAISVNAMGAADETVYMIRDTKNVYVLLTAVGDQGGTYPVGYSVGVSGSNGAFYFDNSKASDNTIKYIPAYSPSTYMNNSYMQAYMKVMRLRIGDDVTLNILKGQKTVVRESLTDLVLDNFPMITTNDDLDRYSDYTFIFSVRDDDTYVLTEIKVDDWSAKPGQNGGI